MSEEKQKKQLCSNCESDKILLDHKKGESVCLTCGFVNELNMSEFFIDPNIKKNINSHTLLNSSSPQYYSNSSVFTEIDSQSQNKKYYLDKSSTQKMYRLNKWHKRLKVTSFGDRNLSFAISELLTIANNLDLPPHVTEYSVEIYKKAVKNNIIRGRSIEGVICASIYTASRKKNVPQTLEELSTVSGAAPKEIGRTYRFLIKSLKIPIEPVIPTSYVPRFCSHLNLPPICQELSIKIIKKIYLDEIHSGRGPIGIASAAIYIACDLLNIKSKNDKKITQRDISEVTGVTEVTIRNRYKEMYNVLKVIYKTDKINIEQFKNN